MQPKRTGRAIELVKSEIEGPVFRLTWRYGSVKLIPKVGHDVVVQL